MDLKKCPFCGGEPQLLIKTTYVTSESSDIEAAIRCKKCAVKIILEDRFNPWRGYVPYLNVEAIAEQIAMMWNKRCVEK